MKVSHLHQIRPEFELFGEKIPHKVTTSEIDSCYFQAALAAICEDKSNIERLLLYNARNKKSDGGIEAIYVGMFKRGIFTHQMIDDKLGHTYNPQTHGKIFSQKKKMKNFLKISKKFCKEKKLILF